MIEHDRKSIGALLEEHGVFFRNISVRDNILRLTLPDMETMPLENILYVDALTEALGLDGAYLTVNNKTIYLERT
jgi:hypothetical protein